MNFKVREFRGPKSLRVWQVFNTLMLGLKMLPTYMGESYEDFFNRVQSMSPADQEKMIREAAFFVELKDDEIEAVASFCEDPNGVSIGSSNIKNLGPKEIIEMIVAVCVAVSKLEIYIISEAEKKKLGASRPIREQSL